MTINKQNPAIHGGSINITPSKELEAAMAAFSDGLKQNSFDDLMEKAVQIAKAQYYPALREITINAVLDLKDRRVCWKDIFRAAVSVIRPAVDGKLCMIPVLIIVKPGIKKALRDLAKEGIVKVTHPRRRKFGAVATYRLDKSFHRPRTKFFVDDAG